METAVLEKPHWGKSLVPFMKSMICFRVVAVWMDGSDGGRGG